MSYTGTQYEVKILRLQIKSKLINFFDMEQFN